MADLVVIGAGPVGSLLALTLARRGLSVDVYERRPDMRRVDIAAGRSINLAVSTRGLHALHEVGLDADGSASALRKAISSTVSEDYLTSGYKELTMPPGSGMHREALHIWPRGSFMLIALPNLDGSFTCTLFWPFEGPNSFAALESAADVLAFFGEQFPDAVPLLP